MMQAAYFLEDDPGMRLPVISVAQEASIPPVTKPIPMDTQLGASKMKNHSHSNPMPIQHAHHSQPSPNCLRGRSSGWWSMTGGLFMPHNLTAKGEFEDEENHAGNL